MTERDVGRFPFPLAGKHSFKKWTRDRTGEAAGSSFLLFGLLVHRFTMWFFSRSNVSLFTNAALIIIKYICKNSSDLLFGITVQIMTWNSSKLLINNLQTCWCPWNWAVSRMDGNVAAFLDTICSMFPPTGSHYETTTILELNVGGSSEKCIRHFEFGSNHTKTNHGGFTLKKCLCVHAI
jgi:hypothetical protein